MKMFASLLFCGSLLSPAAFAKHHEKMPEPTKEERMKMADAHTKMAECLKSDKTMKDCHKEMMDSCKEATGGKCPMMGGHGPMGKMMGKGKMAAPPAEGGDEH